MLCMLGNNFNRRYIDDFFILLRKLAFSKPAFLRKNKLLFIFLFIFVVVVVVVVVLCVCVFVCLCVCVCVCFKMSSTEFIIQHALMRRFA